MTNGLPSSLLKSLHQSRILLVILCNERERLKSDGDKT